MLYQFISPKAFLAGVIIFWLFAGAFGSLGLGSSETLEGGSLSPARDSGAALPSAGEAPTSQAASQAASQVSSIHMPDKPGADLTTGALSVPEEPGSEPDSRPDSIPDSPASIPDSRLSIPASAFVSPPPPLSPEDCLRTFAWARSWIKTAVDASRPSAAIDGAIAPVLRQIERYIADLDERTSSLVAYQWEFLDRQKVGRQGVDTDFFDPRAPIPGASAISLQAEREDVLVHEVNILDASGNRTDYRLNPPVRLRAGLPRREVFHLYFPTGIKRVRARYEMAERRDDLHTARVAIYAGITRRPEYLKSALYYLARARTSLAEGRAAECAEWLARAAGRIQKYQRKQ